MRSGAIGRRTIGRRTIGRRNLLFGDDRRRNKREGREEGKDGEKGRTIAEKRAREEGKNGEKVED